MKMTALKTLSKDGKIKYSDTYNPILEYWQEIENGLPASDKIRRTFKKLAADAKNSGEFFYSPPRANHALEFIENYCKHSKGKMGGKPVRLELWEKAILAAIFGFIDADGLRKYREAVLIVAKKNGKSLIASAVGLYLLTADGEAGPEVYAVATKRDQAKIIWLESKRMRNKSPTLRKRIKALVAELNTEFNDGVFKPLASDVDTLDGLNVHGALMDEFHQWRNGRALFDIIADGVAAREQPLILETSTAGTIREDFYDEKYDYAKQVIDGYGSDDGYKDERFIAFVYELDKREEWTDENAWIKANPGLGTIKNKKTLREKVERAKKNRNLVKNLLCKEFNIRETSSESWLPYEACVNEVVVPMEKLEHSYAIGGCDLSAVRDLTCATLLIRKPEDPYFYVLQKYFLPQSRIDDIEENSKKEAPYKLWAEQGWLTICEGTAVDFHAVTQWFLEMVNAHDIRPLWIGYDRALSGYWAPEMEGEGFSMVKIPQGPRTWTYPMKELGTLLEKHMVIYQNNPMLRWCLTNTGKKSLNENGIESIQPVKFSEKLRIDGMVSLLNAYTCLKGDQNEPDREQQYFCCVR
jgi:phage terminase large subunit-like protein